MAPAIAAFTLAAALPLSLFAATFAQVPNEGSATISIIDTATDQIAGELPPSRAAWPSARTATGSTLAISRTAACSWSRWDRASWGRRWRWASRRKLRDIAVGKLPWGVDQVSASAVAIASGKRWTKKNPLRSLSGIFLYN